MNTTSQTMQAAQGQQQAEFMLKFEAVAGSEEAKQSAIYWLGRQAGKQQRKDICLSESIPQITSAQIQQLAVAQLEQIATVLNDSFEAYLRRVKCQRLEIGGSLQVQMPRSLQQFTESAIRMLSAPAERAKKLVSTSSIRELLRSEAYKQAALQVMAEKYPAWQRVGEREMLSLVCSNDAALHSSRASVRDTAVVRCMEIAALMPADSSERTVLEAAAEMLAEVETRDIDDSI
jgi:hypothetical protein